MIKRCIYCQTRSDVAESDSDCPACGMTNKLTPFADVPVVHGAVAFQAYESPCDGRVIRTEADRREDMARNNCVAYEPGIKQDQERRERSEAKNTAALVDKMVNEVAQRADILI